LLHCTFSAGRLADPGQALTATIGITRQSGFTMKGVKQDSETLVSRIRAVMDRTPILVTPL